MSVFHGARASGSAGTKSQKRGRSKSKGEKTKKKYFKQSELPGARVAKNIPTGEVRMVDITAKQIRALGNDPTFGDGNGLALLNLALPGSSFYQRDGARITMKSLSVRGLIGLSFTNIAASTNGSFGRFLIVYDSQPNGTYPTAADIFQNTSYLGTGSSTGGSFMSAGAKERFVIFRDNNIYLPAVGVNGAPLATPPVGQFFSFNNREEKGNQGSFLMNWHIKLDMMETTFKSAAGNIGDLSTGALYAMFLSTESVASAQSAYMATVSARLKFWP